MTTTCQRCGGPCCHLECMDCEQIHCLLYDCGERGRMMLVAVVVLASMIAGGLCAWAWVETVGK